MADWTVVLLAGQMALMWGTQMAGQMVDQTAVLLAHHLVDPMACRWVDQMAHRSAEQKALH